MLAFYFFEKILICINIAPFIIPVISIFCIIIGVACLSLVIKVSQISFVSELEILSWRYDNYVQFIAFLNNILSLDTGKIQSFNSIMTFMFSGEDAKEDEKEKESRKRFVNALINYSVLEIGLRNTLIILPQIGTSDLQKIFIHENNPQKKLDFKKYITYNLEEMKYPRNFNDGFNNIDKDIEETSNDKSEEESNNDKTDEEFDNIDEETPIDKTDEEFDNIDEETPIDKTDEEFDKTDEEFDKTDEEFDKTDEEFDNIDEESNEKKFIDDSVLNGKTSPIPEF